MATAALPRAFLQPAPVSALARARMITALELLAAARRVAILVRIARDDGRRAVLKELLVRVALLVAIALLASDSHIKSHVAFRFPRPDRDICPSNPLQQKTIEISCDCTLCTNHAAIESTRIQERPRIQPHLGASILRYNQECIHNRVRTSRFA